MVHGDTVIIVILDTDSEPQPEPEHGEEATCIWPARRGGRAQRGAQSSWAGQPGPGLTQAEDRGTEDSARQY